MRAMRLQAYGDVDQFRLENIPVPEPAPGEILMRVHTSAVNHFDLAIRQGLRAEAFPLSFPAILGGDAAGTIVALGAGVAGFAAGDRIAAHFTQRGKGPHADYAVVPVAGIARLPENLSFEQAATLPQVGLTGRQIVDAISPTPGDRVLVAGASGAVGRVAVQYLNELGARVVAGVLPDEIAEARNRAPEVLDISVPPDHPDFDKVVVAVAPAVKNALLHLRRGGLIGAPVPGPEPTPEDVHYYRVNHRDDPTTLQAVLDAAGRGDLEIPIAQTFSLEELAAAHTALSQGPRGKIVIRH